MIQLSKDKKKNLFKYENTTELLVLLLLLFLSFASIGSVYISHSFFFSNNLANFRVFTYK